MRIDLKQVVRHLVSAGIIGAVMCGCARYPALPDGTVRLMGSGGSAVIEREEVTIPVQELKESPPEDYLVGPTDVLLINTTPNAVAVTMQLTAQSGPQAGTAPMPQSAGQLYKVDGSGFITIPLAGRLKVAGLSVGQIQEKLNTAIKKYVKEPGAIVEVSKPSSQPLYLIGAFKVPQVYYLDRPLTVIQGMALGGGPDMSATAGANLRGARLVRDGKIVPVDIYEALMRGDIRYNVWLKGGDTIFIPGIGSTNVFVFGAVSRPGPIPIGNSMITLPQALTAAGFGDLSYDSRIRIIRSLSLTRGELLVVDVDKVMRGESVPFVLNDGDVIYVPRGPIGNWNHALGEILPTLQAVSAVLQPIVQIQYLYRQGVK
jgi:polysaccharide biosynthesis/export protein